MTGTHHIYIPGLSRFHPDHARLLTGTIAPPGQVCVDKDVQAGVLFKDRRQVLGPEQDIRITVDRASACVSQTGRLAPRREEQILDWLIDREALIIVRADLGLIQGNSAADL